MATGDRLFAVVLAAGCSRRFGGTKQLASYRGRPLAAHALRTAEAVCGGRSLLVAGHEAAAIVAACAPLAGFFVVNERYAEGLGGSIAMGVAACAGVADGILLCLADQPFVDPEHLEALAAAWRAAPHRAVATGYAGITGVPAIFPRSDFAWLAALQGDTGARPILESHGERLLTVRFEDAAVDVDRPEDLEGL